MKLGRKEIAGWGRRDMGGEGRGGRGAKEGCAAHLLLPKIKLLGPEVGIVVVSPRWADDRIHQLRRSVVAGWFMG